MLNRRQTLLIVLTLSAALLAGCAGQQVKPMPAFQPAGPAADGYERKVDNFITLFDASSSMGSIDMDMVKFETAKEFAKRMNATLPELGFQDAFISFGHQKAFSDVHTVRHHGLSPYTTDNLARSIDQVTRTGGTTPMDKAITANGKLLKGVSGKTAVILISDGRDMGGPVLDAAAKAYRDFGDGLCLYPVLVGDDPAGRKLMEALADTTDCGFLTQAEDTLNGDAMADFVTRGFLTAKAMPKPAEPKDTDGDGIYDNLDQCPGTSRGTAVDAQGCPLPLPAKPAGPTDMDGDGVNDGDDFCPDTPQGADVDNRGCWVLQGVEFETNKADIRPQYEAKLGEVVDVLHRNPHVKVQIQGHTDSVGNAEYNRQLSEKRARAVMEWLIEDGIDRNRLSAAGLGETRPIANNDTAEGRERNRRVELKPLP